MTDWLIKGSIDFDFISESLLPQQCPRASAPLQVGEMAYDVILVPGCETLRSTTLERLETFAGNGGQLIFLGQFDGANEDMVFFYDYGKTVIPTPAESDIVEKDNTQVGTSDKH